MVIKRLSIYNFGVYAKENTIELNTKKPVVLIGGLNGRGKTTILEAVLLSLYGSNSFAFTESKYKSYGEYLRAHINLNDNSGESYVELEFQMKEETDNNTYRIRRSWNNRKKKIYECVEVYKNNIHDMFLAKNWMMFIEIVLPSALSTFFFFDGEKIAEIAENETGLQMKESIKALLGINVLDTLGSDLKKIAKELTDDSTDDVDELTLRKLRAEKEEAEEKLRNVEGQIYETESKIATVQKKLNKERNRFQEKGGDIVRNAMNLYSEQSENKAELEEINKQIDAAAAAQMPLLLVMPLLKNILAQSETERDAARKRVAAQTIGELFDLFSQTKSSSNEELERFIAYVKETISDTLPEAYFNLSDMANYQLQALTGVELFKISDEVKTMIGRKAAIQKRNDEIAEYLSIDIDEKAVSRIYGRIKKLEYELADLEAELENLKGKHRTVNGEYLQKKVEFSKYVEKTLSAYEKSDERKRTLSFTLLAEEVNQKYKIALQKAKVQNLADTMTECYKKLFGKKNLIYKITMDYDTLDYHYLDSSENEIPKTSLSAGEKQLMVISMLWALALCSKKKLPVIIDTPMARLDSIHRRALIEKYFPFASDQTIILSTDSEIYGDYYKLLKKNSSNQFTLVYDEERKCSSIRTGYFEENNNDY